MCCSGRALDALAGDLGPGDEPSAGPGTEHEFWTVGDAGVICAVWVWRVDFDFDVPRPTGR